MIIYNSVYYINIDIIMSQWDIFDSFAFSNNKSIDIAVTDNTIDISVHEDIHTQHVPRIPNNEELLCSNCKVEEKIIYESGAYYCGSCGIFIKKLLNQKYQYNNFYDDKNNNPCRVGSATNILLPKSSLGSVIYNKNRSYNYNKMAKYNSWNAMPYKERSQWKIFTLITETCNKHKLPKIIIEDSKIYYKHISENVISRGSNRKGLIAACVYNSCKKQKVPRSCKEIAEIFNIELKDMTKGCKHFNEIWRIVNKNSCLNKNNTFHRSTNPLDYIDRFCSNLSIPIKIKNISEIVAIKSITFNHDIVNDNTAPSISAGSVYLVCKLYNYRISKKDISNISKISEVTITKCYKKLSMYKKQLLPKIILQELNL
jgi:transcription initiation factor TFIIB